MLVHLAEIDVRRFLQQVFGECTLKWIDGTGGGRVRGAFVVGAVVALLRADRFQFVLPPFEETGDEERSVHAVSTRGDRPVAHEMDDFDFDLVGQQFHLVGIRVDLVVDVLEQVLVLFEFIENLEYG